MGCNTTGELVPHCHIRWISSPRTGHNPARQSAEICIGLDHRFRRRICVCGKVYQYGNVPHLLAPQDTRLTWHVSIFEQRLLHFAQDITIAQCVRVAAFSFDQACNALRMQQGAQGL